MKLFGRFQINRLRKQLGDSLGEKQMLMYKVKNLNRWISLSVSFPCFRINLLIWFVRRNFLKIKSNISAFCRENALLQDNLVQVQQTFEQRFIEQKNDFEKTERDMRNVITYQVRLLQKHALIGWNEIFCQWENVSFISYVALALGSGKHRVIHNFYENITLV